MWNEFRCRSEEKQQHREVKQAVYGAEQPESYQQEEEMLHDELEGREVENQQDEDAGGDAMENEWNRVLQGEAQATLSVADRSYETLKKKSNCQWMRKATEKFAQLTKVTFAVKQMLKPMLAISTTAAIADSFSSSSNIAPKS